MKLSPRSVTVIVVRRFGALLAVVGQKLQAAAAKIGPTLTADERRHLMANQDFRNLHRGKRAFIVANGPSLARQDLSLLKEEITFTMSGIWKNELVGKRWRPTYYALADSIFFTPAKGFTSVKEFFGNVRRKLKTTTCFVPVAGRPAIQKYGLLNGMKVQYVKFFGSLGEKGNVKDIDLTRPIPGVQTVAQMAIELALYMGCSPIYLLGFDHDWLAKRGPDRHFYQGKTLKNHPKAHGDLDKFSYKEDLEAALTLWEGYGNLLAIAKRQKISIINVTDGGYLDVFPRADYQKLFTAKKK